MTGNNNFDPVRYEKLLESKVVYERNLAEAKEGTFLQRFAWQKLKECEAAILLESRKPTGRDDPV